MAVDGASMVVSIKKPSTKYERGSLEQLYECITSESGLVRVGFRLVIFGSGFVRHPNTSHAPYVSAHRKIGWKKKGAMDLTSLSFMSRDTDTLDRSSDPAHYEHDNALFFVMPFILSAILAGGLFRFVLGKIPSRLSPPYTIILFIFGFLLALVLHMVPVLGGTDYGKGALLVMNIDPHTILLILLPPLLFESSSKIDWHTFKRVAGQSVLLAFPGVLLSMGLTAVFVYFVFDYGWNWYVISNPNVLAKVYCIHARRNSLCHGSCFRGCGPRRARRSAPCLCAH